MTDLRQDDQLTPTPGLKPVVMAVVGVLTLPMIALVLLRARSGMAQTVGDLTILGAASLAVLGTFTAARRGGPNRRGWLLMTLAMSVWAAAQLLWTTYGLTLDHVYPFPALPDIGYIGYSLFAVAALLHFPRVAERGVSRLRVVLDALVIVASIFALSWVLVLETVANSTNSGLALVTSLGYPLADIFVGSFVLALGMRVPSGSRRPWLFLGLGLLVLTLTDSTYMSQTSQGEVGLTGTVLAVGWTSAFLLIAVASQLRTTTAAASTQRHFSIVQELLPYVPLVAVVVVTHDRQFRWEDPVVFVNGAVLLVLFVIQQVLIAVEKVQLARGLEDTVARRTLELSSSEERFRSLIYSSEDAIVARTPQGIVTDWNPAAERIYGYAADEVIGRSIDMFLPLHLREEDRETLRTFASGGLVPNYETERRCKDGRMLSISLTTSPIYVGGELQGVSSISHDITERKVQEAELADARDAALGASRAKSEFLATMSHEIRTPMNGVIGLTELLLDTSLDHVQRRYAAGVRGAGEALLSIIDDILDFSKLEAGKVDLEAVDFDPRELVEEVGVLLATAASGKGLELTAYCDPDVPDALLGDPGRLRQIVINLASNAIKFTNEGEVSLRVGFAPSVDGDGQGDGDLELAVIDTGIGIAAVDEARMFEPFSQADASTTRRYGGTGLGLAICRRLIDAMGGELTMDSTPGRGTAFRCTVPTTARPGLAVRTAPLPALLTGRSVLVVDDNETNQLILQTQLTAWGMRPVLAADGASALRMLREAAADGSPYPFAILDWCMPDMDGVEVATAITRDAALRSTRTMLLSSAGVVDRVTADAAGLVTCINKPVRHSELHDGLVLLANSGAAGAPVVETLPVHTTAVHGRVLVVEDNHVNQLVAEGVLRKLGYNVQLAADGREALEAMRSGAFDAVLMDCHMPEMDGFEATETWRRSEGGGPRLPIIAMTAGVLADDRDRCLAAGMDAFVPKPIDVELLKRTLQTWVTPTAAQAGSPVSDEDRPPDGPVPTEMDMERLDVLRQLGPDDGWGLLPRVVEAFLAEAPAQQVTIHDAARVGDDDALAVATHKLKGAAANLGAVGLAAVCAELEACARGGSGPAGPSAFTRFDDEFDRASIALLGALSGRP